GPGTDILVETSDTNLTLTNTALTGLGNDVLSNIEQASLTGGSNGKTINAAAFTLGPVTIIGGGGSDSITGGSRNDVLSGHLGNDTINGGPGTDTIVESADVSFVLSNTSLSGLGNDTLTSIERAILTGGAGANSIDASGFSVGSATLDGGS